MIKFKTFEIFPEYGTNTYILWDSESLEAVIFDPASSDENLCDFINTKKLKPKYIINTHGHLDHIGGDDFYREKYKIPLAIHYLDADMLVNPELNLSVFSEKEIKVKPADILFGKNDYNFVIGDYPLKIIHTPGHTKGSVCILIDNYLISGDTLFYESIGRTDLPGGDYNDIISSIKNKLFVLPDEIVVLPGHGEHTTIGDEKVGNPFVGMLVSLE